MIASFIKSLRWLDHDAGHDLLAAIKYAVVDLWVSALLLIILQTVYIYIAEGVEVRLAIETKNSLHQTC